MKEQDGHGSVDKSGKSPCGGGMFTLIAGNRLRALRIACGMKPAAAAKAAGYGDERTIVPQWENGKKRIPRHSLVSLLKAYEATSEETTELLRLYDVCDHNDFPPYRLVQIQLSHIPCDRPIQFHPWSDYTTTDIYNLLPRLTTGYHTGKIYPVLCASLALWYAHQEKRGNEEAVNQVGLVAALGCRASGNHCLFDYLIKRMKESRRFDLESDFWLGFEFENLIRLSQLFRHQLSLADFRDFIANQRRWLDNYSPRTEKDRIRLAEMRGYICRINLWVLVEAAFSGNRQVTREEIVAAYRLLSKAMQDIDDEFSLSRSHETLARYYTLMGNEGKTRFEIGEVRRLRFWKYRPLRSMLETTEARWLALHGKIQDAVDIYLEIEKKCEPCMLTNLQRRTENRRTSVRLLSTYVDWIRPHPVVFLFTGFNSATVG